MIARMIHTEEHSHGAEHTELAPAQIKVGVIGRILFKTSHAMRPIAHARQGHRKASTDYRFEPLPFGAPVACPDERISLDARIAFARMSKASHPILPDETLIRSRTIGQGEKVVQLSARKAFVNHAVRAPRIAECTAHIGLEELDAVVHHAHRPMLPPPIGLLLVEEVEDALLLHTREESSRGQSVLIKRRTRAIVGNTAHVEAEEVNVLSIDAVNHPLRIGEGQLPVVVAAAVAETAVEDAPGRIEPKDINRDTLPTHTLHEGDVVMLVGILFMVPRAAAITAKVQAVGRTWHHRAVAGQHLVAINHLLYLGSLDKVIVQFTPIGLPRVGLVRSPSHIPVRRPGCMEKDAVTLVTHHPGHGAVVGAQDVLAAHGRTRPATQFDVKMHALPA